MIEVFDCEEFGLIEIGIDRLLVDGQMALDSRIVDKGYLNFSLAKGQVVFRADRHVGLIPLNDGLAIRVKPRVQIANLAHMIVKSGVAPTAITNFSRGYLPRFEVGNNVEKLYCESLITGVERVMAAGLMKSYSAVRSPPPWRGRLLVSDTIKRHRARNVRYKAEFDYQTLSHAGPENVALKHALKKLRHWLAMNDRKNKLIGRVDQIIGNLRTVPDFEGRIGPLLRDVARSAGRLPAYLSYYRDPLWTAYLILQDKVPDLSTDGFVTLDSVIVDLSKVFEAYIRRVLTDRASPLGWRIVNGEDVIYPFFSDGNEFRVKPDIVIFREGKAVAVLDAKYKPDPKENDRYEVLSFMDAIGVPHGGFVCPARPGSASRYMGLTAGGKTLCSLRFDLATDDLEGEADRFAANVAKLIAGTFDFA